MRDIGVKTAMYGRILYLTFTVAAAIGSALVYWLGGRMVIQGTLEIGTIVAFSLYLARLFGPITGLSNIPVEIKTALVSFNRVFEVLDFPSSIQERLGAVDLVDPKGAVEFEDVWFRYPAGPTVSIASLEEGRTDGDAEEEEENLWILKGVNFKDRAGPDGRPGRPLRRRQEHDFVAGSPPVRHHRRQGQGRRDQREGPDPAEPDGRSGNRAPRTCTCSTTASGPTSHTPNRR